MPDYFPFDPAPRAPLKPLPAGATDCQFHVFGPPDIYPVRPGAAYQMPQATVVEARKLHKTLGVQRGVVVQPTTYGLDHAATLDALAELGPDYRGCAIAAVLNECTDTELEKFHRAGIRGARFNFLATVNLAPDVDSFTRAVARAKELGWFVKIQPGQTGILDSVGLYENIDVPVMIDHMGRPDAGEGIAGPTCQKVLELLAKGNFWVLLSNGHKISKEGPPWDGALRIARAYIEAAPDRVLWASDWPHPLSTKAPPNDGDLVDLLDRYAGDDDTKRKILVDNPAGLFGFP
jgi:2-pyrone-4,6-dicarboxylate lactonase